MGKVRYQAIFYTNLPQISRKTKKKKGTELSCRKKKGGNKPEEAQFYLFILDLWNCLAFSNG